jgi:hypothetical protein
MKGYGWPVLVYDVGQPLLYLFAMGVGLAPSSTPTPARSTACGT